MFEILTAIALGLPAAESAQPMLIGMLRDSDQQVRAAAAEALGALGTPVPVDAIPALAALLRDGYWRVRHSACVALEKLGEVSTPAATALLKVFREGTVNRQLAASALAACGVVGVETLLVILRETARASAQLRVSAVYGLSVVDPGAECAEAVVDALFETSKYHMLLVACLS